MSQFKCVLYTLGQVKLSVITDLIGSEMGRTTAAPENHVECIKKQKESNYEDSRISES